MHFRCRISALHRHPCGAFGVSDLFIKQNLNNFAALYRSVLRASNMASQAKDVIFAIMVIGFVGMLLDLFFARLQMWVNYVE